MRARAVCLTAALMIVLLGFSPPGQAQTPTNLLNNPGFEAGELAPWGSYGGLATFTVVTDCVGATVPEGLIEGKYCLNVKVSGAGANRWDAAFQASMASPPGAVFQKGKKYTLSAWFKSKSGTARIFLSPELNQDPWTGYGGTEFTMTDKWVEYHLTTPEIPADVNPAHLTFHVAYEAQEFWVDDVKWYEGDYVPTIVETKLGAVKPTPENRATDVARDAILSWKAGPFANTHNVYLGTSFEDVNNADIARAAGVGQTGTSFQPVGPLGYGTTYYWRVDEVNAPPDSTVVEGDIWSFTTEPYAYELTGVTATASSSSINQGMTAQKTVDGSGFDSAAGTHSSLDVAMWLTAPGTALPGWIQYEFSQAYLIQQMKVWNSNQKVEPFIGFGAKDVLIEISLDGESWTELKAVELARASGTDDYAGLTVDMGGVLAKFVRLTIQSNWGGFVPQVGLSEVRFMYVPVQAREPSPAMDAENVPVDTALDWRDGRQAASHKVYFSADRAAVADGTAFVDMTTDSLYQPPALDFGSIYYWRVDEVNDAPESDYSGDVWSFTTAEFKAIDDFEAYTNDSPSRVFQAWIDGWGFSPDEFFPNGDSGNGTGSLVGYDPTLGNIMETAIVHGGVQSMPVEYNNVNTPYYSEVERTWTTPQNWTTNGATDLALWFQGIPPTFMETASGVTMSGAGADIYQGTSEFRFAYKKLTGDGSITLRVDNVQTVDNWTKAGVMIRENLEQLCMQVHMISAAQQSLVEWMYRSASNSTTTTALSTTANANPLPVWLRITRAGNVFTGEYSADGTTWTRLTSTDGTSSSTTIVMPSTVYVGMVVCGHSGANLAVADFSQIKTSANVTGQWQVADVGVAQPANVPDQLYVMIQDSTGKSQTVVHPNPKTTGLSAWTQWTIPFEDLAGVNMAAVKKMTIGIGDRNSPKPGAAGMLYIDDIGYGKPIVPVGE